MSTNPYGCYNRKPFKQAVLVQDGWTDLTDGHGDPSRVPRWKFVPFRMREDCSYANDTAEGRADPRCAGCRWKVQP